MKKSKKLGLQSLALVLMAFVLVAGVAFGMTGAWFTDKQDKTVSDLQLGAHVEMKSISAATPTITGTRLNAAGTAVESAANIAHNAVMPGDQIVLTFDIGKVTGTSDFAAKLAVTSTYAGTAITDGAKLGYSVTKTKGGTTAAYLNNDTFYCGDDQTFTITITLKGAEFANSDALAQFNIHVEVRAVQAANYVDSGEGAFAWPEYSAFVDYTVPNQSDNG